MTSRALLFAVLLAGAVVALLPVVRRPGFLGNAVRPSGTVVLDEAQLAPLVRSLADAVPAETPVYVLASYASGAHGWLRYLLYPRPVGALPSNAAAGWLADALPAGESCLVAPVSETGADASAALRARLGLSHVERVAVPDDGPLALYRVRR
jgi:hypothetical protein